MRLISRSDTLLVAALIASAVIVFRQPLNDVIRVIQDIEGRFHLDLLPGLLVLVVAFSFHQYRKWADAHAAAGAAVADAAHARAQTRTLQQLMNLSQALAAVHDRPTLEQVLAGQLTTLAPDARCWLVMRSAGAWNTVLQDRTDTRSAAELGDVAERALRVAAPTVFDADGSTSAQDICFPLRSADTIIGVLGVSGTPSLPRQQHDAICAAVGVVAIGIRNVQLFLETRDLSLRDGLTGCFNRAHAVQTLEAELRRLRRTGSPLSIIMFDIDHFKAVNDRHGHLIGDELLAAVSARLALTTRTSDVRCRYGGDEFLVILPDTPIRGAQQVAEGIRKEVATIRVGEEHVPVSISIGVADATQGELDPELLIERADRALYEAKRAGRDRVSVALAATFVDHPSAAGTSDAPPRTWTH